MSAIAATGSASGYSAVAQLLTDGLPTSPGPQIGQTGSSSASGTSSGDPTDTVDLSDRAKAVLAQAQKDQVLANQLQAIVQSNKNPNGSANTSASGQASDNFTQIFGQLTGQTQSQQPSQQGNPASLSLADLQQADGWLGGLSAYTQAVSNSSLAPDGTSKGYSQSLSDVIVVPSTPQEVANWYQTDGKEVLSDAQTWPDDDPGLAEAIASHSVTLLNAHDIPDLNFHNTITIQGGENGGSGNEGATYNQQAAIFSDPNTSYKVLVDGTVLAWKTPPSNGATTSS